MDRLKEYIYYNAILILCISGLAASTSGGFYADDGRQQSILYKPLAKRDKEELKKEILHLLGLEHIPTPRFHDTHSSAPKYLLDLYKTFEKNEELSEENRSNAKKNKNRSRNKLNDSDVIVSFVNKIHHHSPHLRHEKERKFWFDLSEVSLEEEIVGAELRIYKNATHCDLNKSLTFTLNICSISDESDSNSNTLETVDNRVVSTNQSGWLVFNVTDPVMQWIAFPRKNLGLYLDIKSTSTLDLHELGIIGSRGQEEFQPFMVAYFKSSRARIRIPRAARKRKYDSYYDHNNDNPYGRDIIHSRTNCQRLALYVSFRDLGWQDWIIAPDGYGAFYCKGQCSFPLNAHMNATNHAIVQTLVHLMDPTVVPKPYCAPTQLSAITVLYFDDNSNVILKKYKNMVVKSCGCH